MNYEQMAVKRQEILYMAVKRRVILAEVSVQNFAPALVQVAHEIVNMHNLHTPQPYKIECQICADRRTLILNDVFPY